MPPKEKPKLEPQGKQRAEGEKSTTSDEGTDWLMEAWRKAGYTPFDKCAIAAIAAALGRRTPAVMIAARPAPNPRDLSSSSSSSSPSSSQPTPRTQPPASARKTKAAPLTVRSAAAAESLSSSSPLRLFVCLCLALFFCPFCVCFGDVSKPANNQPASLAPLSPFSSLRRPPGLGVQRLRFLWLPSRKSFLRKPARACCAAPAPALALSFKVFTDATRPST